MDIFSVFMVSTILINILFFNRDNRSYSKNKKIYCFILGSLLFLIGGLRHSSVGTDSQNYVYMFTLASNMSLENTLNFFGKEPGFFGMLKTLTLISDDYQIMFIIISFIYAVSVSRFIYTYSSNPMASFLILIPMSYFAFSLSGLRQTVSLSIIFFSIKYIINRKMVKFTLIVLLASLFHQSALLFLPAYFLSNKSITGFKVLIGIISVPLVFLTRPILLQIAQRFLYEQYSIDNQQEAGGWTTLVVYFLIIIVALIFYKQIKNPYFPLFVKLMYVGALIQMFVPYQANIFRISMYYNIASIIILPDILKTQNEKVSKFVAYFIFFLLMGIMYYMFSYNAAGVQPYNFYWERLY